MRNYQYTPQEEAEMDAFGNEWKKHNRGIKGPSAWREFKQKHPWAKRITADALRQKYTRMKRDQYWKAYAVTHAKCPRGHAVCYANPSYDPGNISSITAGINNYVSVNTSTIPDGSPLPATSNSPSQSQPNAVSTSTSPAPVKVDVLKDDISVELGTAKVQPSSTSNSQTGNIVSGSAEARDFLNELKKVLLSTVDERVKKLQESKSHYEYMDINGSQVPVFVSDGISDSAHEAIPELLKIFKASLVEETDKLIISTGITSNASQSIPNNSSSPPLVKVDDILAKLRTSIKNGSRNLCHQPKGRCDADCCAREQIRDFLNELKKGLLNIVDERVKKFQDSGAGQLSNSAREAVLEFVKKLMASLVVEMDQLITSVQNMQK